MYESGFHHRRSDAERLDMFLAWDREDRAFFAAGACHILAHQFLSLHQGDGFTLREIVPFAGLPGSHLFASDGAWAFDFNGWTPEAELLAVHAADFIQAYPGWNSELRVIPDGLPEYLKSHHHLRPPEYFPELPWRRAYDYIAQFPASPPG